MATDVTSATLDEIKDMYEACYKLARALQEFHQGTDGEPGVNAGRFTDTELNTMVNEAYDALDAVYDGEDGGGGGVEG